MKHHIVLTGHMNSVGEEVTCISYKENDATLDLWEFPDLCKLKQQRRAYAHGQANQQAAEEDKKEVANGLNERQDCEVVFLFIAFYGFFGCVSLCCVEQDDRDGIVENGFAKDDCVKVGIDLVSIEDGKDSNRIGC